MRQRQRDGAMERERWRWHRHRCNGDGCNAASSSAGAFARIEGSDAVVREEESLDTVEKHASNEILPRQVGGGSLDKEDGE